MIKIIFIRHGESTENIADKTGKIYDPNNIILTTKGEEQAKKTGEYLSKIFGNNFDHIISSPAKRCVQTANIIIKQINFNKSKIIIDDLIMEIGGMF
jgi:broad specificity phosphatase PhoE